MTSLVDAMYSDMLRICEISMKMIDQDKRPNVQPNVQAGRPREAEPQHRPEAQPVPASPHPLDGSQYHGVIEEQARAEQPPTEEEQAPRRVRHLPDPAPVQPHPDDPSISVGGS